MNKKSLTDTHARHFMTTCPRLDHRLITTMQASQLMQVIEGLRGQSLHLADTLKAISPPRHDMTTITKAFRECLRLMNDESE